MKKLHFLILVIVITWFTACNSCNHSKGREKPDVSAIKVDVAIQRFDKDLAGFATKDYHQQLTLMRKNYGPFFDFYIEHFVIGPRPAGDTADILQDAIGKYLADPYMHRLEDSINHHFPNTTDVEAELVNTFKYYKYYFPNAVIPKVYTVNSGFAMGAFTYGNDVLAVCLDSYIGPNNIDFDSAGIYQYLQHKMRKEYIARNAMDVIYNLNYGGEDLHKGETLLEGMVEKGKKMYFLSYVLPDAPDSMIVGYTDKQVKWCEANEYDIWKFLNDKDMLYKSSYMDLKRYLDEGPTTPGMPDGAPGNIGTWIGWRIVNKFMKESGKKVTLQDMVTKYDAKAIINAAKYRPSKSAF